MSQELTELQQQIVRFYHHNPFVEYLHIQVRGAYQFVRHCPWRRAHDDGRYGYGSGVPGLQ